VDSSTDHDAPGVERTPHGTIDGCSLPPSPRSAALRRPALSCTSTACTSGSCERLSLAATSGACAKAGSRFRRQTPTWWRPCGSAGHSPAPPCSATRTSGPITTMAFTCASCLPTPGSALPWIGAAHLGPGAPSRFIVRGGRRPRRRLSTASPPPWQSLPGANLGCQRSPRWTQHSTSSSPPCRLCRMCSRHCRRNIAPTSTSSIPWHSPGWRPRHASPPGAGEYGCGAKCACHVSARSIWWWANGSCSSWTATNGTPGRPTSKKTDAATAS